MRMLSRKGHSGHVHVLIGFAVLALAYYANQIYGWYDVSALTYTDYAFIAFVTWVYSQLPDVDNGVSTINRYATLAGVGLIVYAFLKDEQTLGIATALLLGLFRVIEHRTVIHSVVAAAVFAAPLWYLSPLYAVVGFVMFVAHILSEGEFSMLFEKDWHFLK